MKQLGKLHLKLKGVMVHTDKVQYELRSTSYGLTVNTYIVLTRCANRSYLFRYSLR